MSYSLQNRLKTNTITTTDYYSISASSNSSTMSVEMPTDVNIIAPLAVYFVSGDNGTNSSMVISTYYYYGSGYVYVNARNLATSTATFLIRIRYLYTDS